MPVGKTGQCTGGPVGEFITYKRFEYRILEITQGSAKRLDSMINELAKEGYELIWMTNRHAAMERTYWIKDGE